VLTFSLPLGARPSSGKLEQQAVVRLGDDNDNCAASRTAQSNSPAREWPGPEGVGSASAATVFLDGVNFRVGA
jgi:hypothetical protein